MMRGMPTTLLLVILFAFVQVSISAPQAPKAGGGANVEVKKDEAFLQKKNLPVDGKGLLKYFQDRTFREADPQQVAVLVKQLGSANFDIREEAYEKIQAFGTGAVISLKKAKNNDDAEIRARIRQLLQQIEEVADPRVQTAVARLIAVRKPTGAAKVLLAYLPFADENVIEEIRRTLTALATENGKDNPDLVAALTAKLPVQRKVAGEALVRGNARDQFPAVRKLLQDPDAHVRLRVALALAQKKELAAIPVLIDVLKDLSPEQLWPAENILVRLAGDNTPEVSLGTNEADRKKAWQAWNNWWKQQKREDIEKRLVKLDDLEEYKGYIQVIYQTNQRIVGGVLQRAGREIMEVGAKRDFNKPRWNFVLENTFPVDVQVIGNKRLLVTEYTGRRITIRDFDGRILKEHYLPTYPISADKLPGGNFFVVMRNQLVEYDSKWKKVWSYGVPGTSIYRATRLHDDRVVFVNASGNLCFLDTKKNRIVKSVSIGTVGTYYGGLEVLANGNVLVPRYSANQVLEYDRNGKLVWRATVHWPTTATRLPNGDTLVGSLNTRQLVQINRRGQVMWSRQLPGQIYRVRVR